MLVRWYSPVYLSFCLLWTIAYFSLWGFGGGGDNTGETDNPQLDELVISRASGQPSDASSSSAATTGVSMRNPLRFTFSPSPSAASKGGCEIFSENSASDAVAIDNGAIIQPPLDEPWPLDRESRAGSAAQLPPRSSRGASDASSTMSTAQTLPTKVTPCAWWFRKWRNKKDGERAGTGDVADGDDEPNGICFTAAYKGEEEGTIAEPLASGAATNATVFGVLLCLAVPSCTLLCRLECFLGRFSSARGYDLE